MLVLCAWVVVGLKCVFGTVFFSRRGKGGGGGAFFLSSMFVVFWCDVPISEGRSLCVGLCCWARFSPLYELLVFCEPRIFNNK